MNLKQIHGKQLSYNNYNDIFSALTISRSLPKGKGTVIVTCRKGMKTDLASVPRACWALISPWDVARAAIIHDHLYAALRSYCDEEDYLYTVWKRGKDLSDTIFLLGMKSADPKVPKWKIYPAYWAVRLFGSWSAK